MTQIFTEEGRAVPVTVIEAGPVTVTQVKDKEKDGYYSVQVAFGHKNKMGKALLGQIKKAGADALSPRWLKEFRLGESSELALGAKIDVSIFEEGEKVSVTGTSRGKGFQGVVKRHNFRGMPASHGHKGVTRASGSIGQRFPQHTLKGMRMAGRTGATKETTRNLKIVKVDPENNRLLVRGAVPGRRGSLLAIKSK